MSLKTVEDFEKAWQVLSAKTRDLSRSDYKEFLEVVAGDIKIGLDALKNDAVKGERYELQMLKMSLRGKCWNRRYACKK